MSSSLASSGTAACTPGRFRLGSEPFRVLYHAQMLALMAFVFCRDEPRIECNGTEGTCVTIPLLFWPLN